MRLGPITSTRDIRHGHLFCGIGGGAKGFNRARPRVGNVEGRFRCVGGVDVDVGAIRNFGIQTGTPGTVLDLFSREQYTSFHGREPSREFREAGTSDIQNSFGSKTPDVIFLSAPCKGFSGLLSATQSKTDKYQALNGLTLRGVWLTLEAYKDDPVPVILFENVPRILTRGRFLLDQIVALLHAYGYNVNLDTHDCGVIGNLAQSRKRALLIARHREKVPPFVYQPKHHKLRGVGEVIGKLPLPGDPIAGAMHRVPALQWKTWVRLAFVPAGKDWRALNDLAVVDGNLRDFGIIPEHSMRDNALGVCGWGDTAPVISSQRSPGQGRFSVADIRGLEGHHGVLGVQEWKDTSGAITSRAGPTNGTFAVADIRVDGHPKSVQLGVRKWEQAAACVKGDVSVGTGPYAVGDPRLEGVRFNNTFRIVAFEEFAPALAGPGGPAGGIAVADPRPEGKDNYTTTKYKVCSYEGFSRAVIGASTTGDGAFAVADPKPQWGTGRHRNILKVTPDNEPAGTIAANAHSVTGGQACVADSRREHYQTGGHYGVVGWHQTGYAVSGSACHDNGFNSVADEREVELEPAPFALPAADERLVCRIISTDGTWHRPFTTLDLAALQSLLEPEEIFYEHDGIWHARMPFDLEGASDVTKREWIGNMVPGAAATAMAETIGEALLLADAGETFFLDPRQIWVKPGALALAVDNDQFAYRLDSDGRR